MERQTEAKGANIKQGVLSVPSGTIKAVQFCKNGVVRLSRSASLRLRPSKTRGGTRPNG